METKLNILKAELQLENEMYHVVYDNMMKELDTIINKWFVKPFNAICTRKWLNNTYMSEEISVNFEIGFYNSEENQVDFGSDMWFTYQAQLETNYGTTGTYGKHSIYQVKRVMTLAHVWENIDTIETELAAYVNKITPIVQSHVNKEWEIEHEIRKIEHAIKEEVKRNIESSLTVGDTVTYDESVRAYNKLFNDYADTWKIHNVCAKTIKIKAVNCDKVKQLDKNIFLDLIANGKLHVTKQSS